jgi:tetratricopeptide (TPR) repeat protein
MDARLEAVKQRIALLSVIDTDRQVFGAATHGYALAPPMSGDDLGMLELSLHVALPDEVRAFLRKVGASGAGPYYGLLAFGGTSAGETDDGAPRSVERLVLADQGCGMTSLLLLGGKHRGEVWTDTGDGELAPEADSFVEWYEAWLDRALLEWVERAAPRLAIDGPDAPAELEAAALAIDLLVALKKPTVSQACSLGYLHLRERRFEDSDAAFVKASRAPDPHSDILRSERTARLHRDRANIAYVRDDFDASIREANDGLAIDSIWASTADELREVLERALHAAGRAEQALAILEIRATNAYFDFAVHHRLATELLARGNVKGAIAVLERAANMPNIGGHDSTPESRVTGSFHPIIAALRAGGRAADAEALEARADVLLHAN